MYTGDISPLFSLNSPNLTACGGVARGGGGRREGQGARAGSTERTRRWWAAPPGWKCSSKHASPRSAAHRSPRARLNLVQLEHQLLVILVGHGAHLGACVALGERARLQRADHHRPAHRWRHRCHRAAPPPALRAALCREGPAAGPGAVAGVGGAGGWPRGAGWRGGNGGNGSLRLPGLRALHVRGGGGRGVREGMKQSEAGPRWRAACSRYRRQHSRAAAQRSSPLRAAWSPQGVQEDQGDATMKVVALVRRGGRGCAPRVIARPGALAGWAAALGPPIGPAPPDGVGGGSSSRACSTRLHDACGGGGWQEWRRRQLAADARPCAALPPTPPHPFSAAARTRATA